MKRILILIPFIILISQSVYSQVATPSLDPTDPLELAAAGAWRFGSTIGGGYTMGTQKADGSQVDTNTLANFSDLENVGSSYIFAYQPTTVTFEISGILNNTDYAWDGTDSTTDHVTAYDETATHIKLAIRGNNQVSVGVEYYTSDSKDTFTDTKVSTIYYGGSFGMRFMDNIFIAGGLNRITQKSDYYDSDLKYDEVIGGIALQMGAPDQSMFKIEGALKIRSKAETEMKNSSVSVEKPQTTTVQGSIEALFGGFLTSFQYKNTTIESTDNTDERDIVNSRLGLGYRGTSLTIMAYGENRIETEGDNMYNTSYFSTNFSYSFM